MWANDATVASWIQDQIIEDVDELAPLLGLQNEERWLVVVTDFSDSPAGENDLQTAERLLQQSAIDYVHQMSGGASELDIDVHPRVVRAPSPSSAYGADLNGRDTGTDGTFLPLALAEHVVQSVANEVNWSVYDLNTDGSVDRVLILHTTIGQEEGPSNTQRIWSHFTHFETSIVVGADTELAHYTMASLETGSSGVGTILHEMLHQMGALDLYPVHSESSYQAWKGVGDWDIMASGNWNGGGRWPALPTGATLDIINAERTLTLDLTWPEGSAQPCFGPTVTLEPLSEGGQVLAVPIGPDETVFIEWRNDSGYDARLPGHCVLVTILDRSVGDVDQNEVNTNPQRPYLRVLEADGQADLTAGNNAGEADDVFLNGTQFGAEGIPVRNHDGVLVPWIANVTRAGDRYTVAFTAPNCSPSFTLDLNDHGSTGLVDEDIPITLEGARNCTNQLNSSDGRGVVLAERLDRLRFSSGGVPQSTIVITGTIACDGTVVDLHHTVQLLNRVPTPAVYDGVVSPTALTELTVTLPSRGAGEQRFEVHIDGPLARVGSGPSDVVLSNGSTYTLTINPNGLLTENMLISGELVLSNDAGSAWTYPIELKATDGGSPWPVALSPGQVIAIACWLVALYAALSARQPTRSTVDNDATVPPAPSLPAVAPAAPITNVDAWGRIIDDGPAS